MKRSYVILAAAVILLALTALLFAVWLYPGVIKPAQDYRKAVKLYNSGEYVLAALAFESLEKYPEQAKNAWLNAGDASVEKGELAQARAYYLRANADSSVYEKIDAAYYEKGVAAYASDQRIEGENCFSCISYNSRYASLLDPVRIGSAQRFLVAGDFDSAEKTFKLCSSGSYAEISRIWLDRGRFLMIGYDFDSAALCFSKSVSFAPDKEAALDSVDAAWEEAGLRAESEGRYDVAELCFARVSTVSEQLAAKKEAYDNGVRAYNAKSWTLALSYFTAADGYLDASDYLTKLNDAFDNCYAAGAAGVYAVLTPDGSVTLCGDWGGLASPDWTNITRIAVGGDGFILGLKSDGRVFFAGSGESGASAVDGWRSITEIAAGKSHSVGLKSDGTVVACGNDEFGQVSGVRSWTNITAIAAFGNFTVGLRADGTVVACGDNSSGQLSVSRLSGVKAIAAGLDHCVFLHNNGTVTAVGSNSKGQTKVSGWSNIEKIFAGSYHTVGLTRDGKLVACGSNDNGECGVSGLQDVLAVAAGDGFTVVLLKNGTELRLGSVGE
ncbi:MAG: hypothetical protein J5854_07755 [Clostridia bacterium]|nr:hypothetical protein [Clostridia bacterium]